MRGSSLVGRVGMAATTTPLSMVFGCGAFVDTLPYGSALLDESLVLMMNVEDQWEMIPKSALVRHPNDHLLPWCNSAELPRRYEDIILYLSSMTPIIPHRPSALVHSFCRVRQTRGLLRWKCLGGIETGLAAVLKAGLMVQRYVYVDNSQMSIYLVRHHFYQMMALYSQQLHPNNVTLISEADLGRLDLVDMVIAGWPCQGHSRVGAGQDLEDPRSSLLWDLSGLHSGGLSTNLLLQCISLINTLCWETLRTRCWKVDIMFVNTLEISFSWMP